MTGKLAYSSSVPVRRVHFSRVLPTSERTIINIATFGLSSSAILRPPVIFNKNKLARITYCAEEDVPGHPASKFETEVASVCVDLPSSGSHVGTEALMPSGSGPWLRTSEPTPAIFELAAPPAPRPFFPQHITEPAGPA